jgi:large subunit ribosomal protein L21
MFAFIKHSGKQFKVAPGVVLTVDKIDLEPGKQLEISDVPLIVKDDESIVVNPKAKVICTVKEHFRAKKILIIKQRPKKGYRRKNGHRQNHTKIEIQSIEMV